MGKRLELFATSLKLGLTSFGGPVAHLGYFFDEYVKRKRWLDETSWADTVALCQFLPGPASSQLGMAIGIHRAGLWGGVLAWLGFTLPSAFVLWAFALLMQGMGAGTKWFHGLLVAAVAVVAQAVWSMGKKFANRASTGLLALACAALLTVLNNAYAQILVLVIGGLLGWWLFREAGQPSEASPLRRRTAVVALALFGVLLVGLPLLAAAVPNRWLELAAGFYRAGALVFGGGHVVLPLLQQVVVPQGWVSNAQFLTGYGAAQAVPGPLFTFAAYLGAVCLPLNAGVWGAMVGLLAIFLPSYLLVVGALPFWHRLRSGPRFRGALIGVNVVVVGILLAALYNPVASSALLTPGDFALALVAFGLLQLARWPSWAVVAVTAGGGVVLALLF